MKSLTKEVGRRHEEERFQIGCQEIRCQESCRGKSSELARAVGTDRLAGHSGAQSAGRRLQPRRGSRTGRDSRLLMALFLARATAQIQSYLDFLHQYNRLPVRSLKRFEERRGQVLWRGPCWKAGCRA